VTTAPIPLGDTALERLIATELEGVEAQLLEVTEQDERLIGDASRHLVAAGGKRLRPALVLLTSMFGTGIDDQVRQSAVAVELTHLATLYHDDVMDSAPLRRGAPSAHEVWGNSIAILTGDLLFARASRLVSELGPRAVRIQADAFERLVLGQMHETLGPAADEDPIEHYIGVLADKTGSLIAAAAHYGTLFAQAPAVVREAAVRYGEYVGVAFQLADDVIDLSADEAATGKAAGTDLREGVATMPVLLLRQHAGAGTLDAAGHQLLADLDADLTSDAALDDVLRRLREHPVVSQARDLAQQWSARAVAELEPMPESVAKNGLAAFAQLLADRLA